MTSTASAPDRPRAVAAPASAVARLAELRSAASGRARALARSAARRLHDVRADERGDVPGWVLISIMTAGIVMVLWATAGDLLVEVFENAIDRVAEFG